MVAEAKLEVVLVNRRELEILGEAIIASAGRVCYSSKSFREIVEELEKLSPQERANKTEHLIRLFTTGSHGTPAEHLVYRFSISGISRACSHQLVRHRIGWSWNQQSQRYVPADKIKVVVPPHIAEDENLKARFLQLAESAIKGYIELKEALFEKFGKESAQEDARFLLPNACETRLACTVNARALIQSARLRLCARAQWEIRSVFQKMREEIREVTPTVASAMVPKCEYLGYCDEGKMSCGRMPLKEEVLGFYRQHHGG